MLQLAELEEGAAIAAFLETLETVEAGQHDYGEDKDGHDNRDRARRWPPATAVDGEGFPWSEPPVRAALAQTEDEHEHAATDEHGARQIEAGPAVRAAVPMDEQQGAEDGRRGHDHVDAQGPTPRVIGGEEAADRWAEGGGRTHGGAPG